MSTVAPITFAVLLRRHRLAAGLTQEDLAGRSGLSVRGIQDLERGVRTAPRAETVRLLAGGLGLDDDARAALIAAAQAGDIAPPTQPVRSRLPVPRTSLIGREREVAEACALLRGLDGTEGTRLLTLTGPGGVGKTRLALAIAGELTRDSDASVVWVELAHLDDPALVAAAIARALGVQESERPPAELLAAAVAQQSLLLVLDNCEHLLPAMSLVADLLTAGPRLTVLATSRARLRLRGEREMPVSPLPVPAAPEVTSWPLEELVDTAAVRLFVERAGEGYSGFALTQENAAAVATICRRLDGLPLALELAAARTKLLPPAALSARLEQRLSLLSGGPRDAPARQETLRDTIAWSYDLLNSAEQRLFRRLAVFAGGFTLEAAELLSGSRDAVNRGRETLELLGSLVDQSLIRVSAARGEPRFTLLQTVREFAGEMLDASGEGAAIRQAHAGHVLARAEAAQARIHSPEGATLLSQLEVEHENLRAALAWLIEAGEPEPALRLAYALWRFWWMRSHLHEGRNWLERALAMPDTAGATSALRPKTLVAAGYFARVQGDYAHATAMGEEALALARQIDDRHGISSAYHLLGLTATDQGELDLARAHLETALVLDCAVGYSHGIAFQLSNLGDVALVQGHLAEAAELGEQALAIWRDRGDTWSAAWALVQLGRVKRAEGDVAGALALLRQSLVSSAALGDKEIAARAMAEVAAIAGERAQFTLAAQVFGCVAGLREAIGAPQSPAERARYEEALILTRAALDEVTFNQCWDVGRALSLEQAVKEALAAAGELG